jgi:1-acyl-sn-glycerol-3-phosphate acyltransferase
MFYHIFRGGISLLLRILTRRRTIGLDSIPARGGLIIVANHINLLDSPILGVSLKRHVYFMAKEELFHSFVIGWLVTQFGAFPVAKGKLDRRAGKTALELLSQGEAIVIFPEGKRSENGKLGPAYHGAALLSIRSGAPILPVGISGTAHLVGKFWFWRRPVIGLNIGRPFTLAAVSDKLSKEETHNLTHNVMQHIAALLPPEYRGRYAEGIKDETGNK